MTAISRRLLAATAAVALLITGCTSAEDRRAEREREEQESADRVAQSLGYEDAADQEAQEEAGRVAEEEERARNGLAAQVERSFTDSYGPIGQGDWSMISGFDDRDAPRVTVITRLAYKTENEPIAEGFCRAVTSVTVDADFEGAYVTAGEGGGFLAECDKFGG